ncbi:DeoR/GlpR family DNA-binding transcription regulator [Clostridium aestuarii]|uniref:DeoR/GlpR family DNA-binding transcription regulator n=1 Tax=Clostridium aestuarii TaxID=338193 RepID=A0ABT4D1V1_9CLOT|nr:DeoR/GlpR family DNA-binding transcription regulator [Clostridium aestuarii]MCY6484135.1 DeoR/GlpR family DNA-binding transcription regulator [Clostridium aestuarii]
MLLEERRKNIIEYLQKHGKAEVEQLSKKLDVSAMTIRRDLAYLQEKGLIVRTHGGAICNPVQNYEIPYLSKESINKEEKEKIGKAAVELILEKQSIIIDAGTTCLEIAKNLNSNKDITVITNDIKIASIVYNYPDVKLFCAGGFVQPNLGAMFGNYAEKFIESINVDYAFIGVSTIDDEFVISTPTFEKAFLKKKMMDSANKVVMLADSSKFNKRSLAKICKLEDIDILITDNKITYEMRQEIEKIIPKLIIV